MTDMNYDLTFIGPIKSGAKTHTIRQMRSPDDKPKRGGKLRHFALIRPYVHTCFHASICSYTQEVQIDESGMKLDGVALAPNRILELAKSDGFETAEAFRDYFRDLYGFPFCGVLISWA